MSKHLIHRDDLDQINEYLSQRAAADVGRTVGFSIIGYVIVALGIVYGVFVKDPNPKIVAGILGIGALISFLGKVSNIHLNDPSDFR